MLTLLPPVAKLVFEPDLGLFVTPFSSNIVIRASLVVLSFDFKDMVLMRPSVLVLAVTLLHLWDLPFPTILPHKSHLLVVPGVAKLFGGVSGSLGKSNW